MVLISLLLLAITFLCLVKSHNFSFEGVENYKIQKATKIYNAPEETGINIVRSINASLGNHEKQMVDNLNEDIQIDGNGILKSNREKIYNELNDEHEDNKDELHPQIVTNPSPTLVIKTPSLTNHHPYVVLVINIKSIPKFLGCSGSILTTEWVLTSAQCIMSLYGVQQVFVYAGGSSVQEVIANYIYEKPLPPNAQFRRAEELVLHPEYNSDNERPDIGLIRVENKFIFTGTVEMIRLSITPWKGSNADGSKTCIVSKIGNFRKTFTAIVRDPCLCQDEFVDFYGSNFYRLRCSKPMGDTDFCDGISGAGLVCDGEIHAVSPTFVPFKDNGKCKIPKRPVPSMSVCDVYNSLVMYEDTCPYIKWINNYTHIYSDDEIVECAASIYCLPVIVKFTLLLFLWIC